VNWTPVPCIWSIGRKLGHGWREKEEKEGDVHGWRARRRRLGKTDFQRGHKFEENEDKKLFFSQSRSDICFITLLIVFFITVILIGLFAYAEI
jgi:hypothetical protein